MWFCMILFAAGCWVGVSGQGQGGGVGVDVYFFFVFYVFCTSFSAMGYGLYGNL